MFMTTFFLLSCREQEEIRTYFPDGSVKSTVTIVDGKKNGRETYFYEHGIKRIEFLYYSDSLVGQILSYYENGDPEYIINVVDWKAKWFSRDGKTYMLGKLKNFKREGEWYEYLRDGDVLLYKWSYFSDIKNGMYIGYWSKYTVKLVGTYKNGALDGTVAYLDEAGHINRIEVWKADSVNKSSELVREIILRK